MTDGLLDLVYSQHWNLDKYMRHRVIGVGERSVCTPSPLKIPSSPYCRSSYGEIPSFMLRFISAWADVGIHSCEEK
jgi:hypothetical protein